MTLEQVGLVAAAWVAALLLGGTTYRLHRAGAWANATLAATWALFFAFVALVGLMNLLEL